jgi:hypothetical protein
MIVNSYTCHSERSAAEPKNETSLAFASGARNAAEKSERSLLLRLRWRYAQNDKLMISHSEGRRSG